MPNRLKNIVAALSAALRKYRMAIMLTLLQWLGVWCIWQYKANADLALVIWGLVISLVGLGILEIKSQITGRLLDWAIFISGLVLGGLGVYLALT